MDDMSREDVTAYPPIDEILAAFDMWLLRWPHLPSIQPRTTGSANIKHSKSSFLAESLDLGLKYH